MNERIALFVLDNANMVFLALVFSCALLVFWALTTMVSGWADLRRRAVAGAMTPLQSSLGADATLLTGNGSGGFLGGLMPAGEAEKNRLRQFLNLAGFYGAATPSLFQLIRLLSATGFGFASAVIYGRFIPGMPFVVLIALSAVVALLGYILPRAIVSFRRDRLMDEHRQGFPDFLDLLVICIEAGIGIDSAVGRVSADLARTYPSLARNLSFMNLELRAGRSTREAFDNLCIRLGIEEARSFATVVQQSEELGSSLVQSLRVYSDEMRKKRLARAEEKASSLPVKMVLPLALFIFPVILGVTLMPVAIKLFQALGIK